MSTRLETVTATPSRDWPTGVSFALLVVAFGVIAGPLGVLAGIATAIVGYTLGIPYALAAGHVALVAAVPNGIDPLSFVIVEAAFVAVLLAPMRRTASPGRIALVAVTSAIVLAGTAWLVVDSQPIWVAATAVLALLAIGSYGLHRLQLVRLGLVTETDDGDSSPGIDVESTADPTTEPSAETTSETPTDT